MKKECDLCGKGRKNYEGVIWYSILNEKEMILCRSCYLSWCRSKVYKSLLKKYKKVKPKDRLWGDVCDKLQLAFNDWVEKRER